jgi:hypothetical protein
MTQTISVCADDTCDIYVELGTPAEPALVRWSAPRPPAGYRDHTRRNRVG